MMSSKHDFNIFIGGKTGILKGLEVNSEKIIAKNLHSLKNLTSGSEITALTWGDESEVDVLIGTKEQSVKVYDTEFKSFSSSLKTKYGEGPIVGLTRFNNVITTCTTSGHIRVWNYNKDKAIELDTKGKVEKMEGARINSGIVATGGFDNDLKLWDLTTGDAIFKAKHVRNNELQLEVRVWISDIRIVPDTEHTVAVCSRYGHVRLYDTKVQRRPVIDLPLVDQSLQCIALGHREKQVVVGSGTGYVLLIDFRMTGPNRVVTSFRGATGSVRQLVCHPTKPYLASVGLDSYFRLHNVETKKLLRQQFMQVKLNSVLMRSDFEFQEDRTIATNEVESKVNEGKEEMDAMFEKMETVGGRRQRVPRNT